MNSNHKLFYIDVETTGTNPKENGLVQIAGIIEVGGQIVEEFNLLIQPIVDDIIEDEALNVIGKTMEDLRDHNDPARAYEEFVSIMDKYIDRYDSRDKFYFIGYNSRFDDSFIRAWFNKLNDKYYGSWFHWPAIDVANIAALQLMDQRDSMSNFKLMTVADALGIDVEEEKAHDALYDVQVTRKIYKQIAAFF